MELLAQLRPTFERLGITRVADITGLDHLGVPVVMVCRPNERSLSVSQGKGLDLARAKISGVMESIELWHAEHLVEPVEWRSTAAALGDPQFLGLEGLRVTGAVPRAGDEVVGWLEGRDLATDRAVLVPTPILSLDTRAGQRPRGWSCSSNGLGAGSRTVAAMLHGLLEVIERDAVTLWQQRSPLEKTLTRLDLARIERADLRGLLDHLAVRQMLVGAWDATSDLGVPTCLVHLMARGDEPHLAAGWEFGSAARMEPADALLAALLEAIQARLTQIAGARDDIGRDCYRALEPSTVLTHRLLLNRNGSRHLADMPGLGGGPDDLALQALLRQLERCGVGQCVAVDLGREDIGVPVVKMIVPELEDGIGIEGWQPGPRARAAAAIPQR